jgi:hypothetical protein
MFWESRGKQIVLENRISSVAQASPVRAVAAAERPSRLRSQMTNDPLKARTDRNTARGRRVADLYLAYMAALDHPADTIVQANAMAAAELKVAAEDARKRILDVGGDANGLVRLENLAHRAERKLGLDRRTCEPGAPASLSEYLESAVNEFASAPRVGKRVAT